MNNLEYFTETARESSPWLFPFLFAALFGFGNMGAHLMRKSRISAKVKSVFFIQGAFVGALLGASLALGFQVFFIRQIIVALAIAQIISTLVGLVVGAITKGKKGVINACKLCLGNFYLDENKSFFAGIWEGISRHSYQILQSNISFHAAQFSNAIGKISHVAFWGGATFSYHNYNGSSLALGNNILLANAEAENLLIASTGGYTAMHEYGHYIQSQVNGFSYLFNHGFASASGATWTELDANLRAAIYFEKHEGEFKWDTNYYTKQRAIYSDFPENLKTKNTTWWEWLVFPFCGFWK